MSLANKLLSFTRRRVPRVQLLTRPGCHLCEEAQAALDAVLGAEKVDLLDITQHPELEELYVFRIPVVLYEGDVMAEGVIGKAEARTLRKALVSKSAGQRAL